MVEVDEAELQNMEQQYVDTIATLQRELEAVRAERDALREALEDASKAMHGVEVFVKSRERINRTTGEAWFDLELAGIDAALSQPTATQEAKNGDELRRQPAFAWVIERGGSEPAAPTYWAGHDRWSQDHMDAIRFARQLDAERVSSRLSWPACRVCEHGWTRP